MRNKKGQYVKGKGKSKPKAKPRVKKPKSKARAAHRMPDGRMMSGKTHTKSSKPILGEKERPSPIKGRAGMKRAVSSY